MATLGRFPFGRSNDPRPMRRSVGETLAVVVGVYPSAFHVAWSPPPQVDQREPWDRRRPFIGSLAVDVEPVVFWDGRDPDPVELLAKWASSVGLEEARHGTVRVGRNGPSGSGLVDGLLGPLGLDLSNVAFTDVVPWFFVKNGSGGQGEAMRSRFAPIAETIGVHGGSLPVRPTPRLLVEIAASPERRERLREELAMADGGLVITLGQEALDAVRRVADTVDGVQDRLEPEQYGQRGHICVGGAAAELLPLAHPGFQRLARRSDWVEALQRWRESGGSG